MRPKVTRREKRAKVPMGGGAGEQSGAKSALTEANILVDGEEQGQCSDGLLATTQLLHVAEPLRRRHRVVLGPVQVWLLWGVCGCWCVCVRVRE